MASLNNQSRELRLPEGFEAPEGWCPVAIYGSPKAAHEAGLAILAMGQAYWLQPHGEEFILCVASAGVEAVRSELEVFKRIGATRTAKPVWGYHEFSFGASSFVLYAFILISGFVWQQFAPLVDAGRVDANAMVEQAEWWRAVTALTLHGDVVHLISNLVAGLGFSFFVARFFAAPAGWFLILLSGALGNALNAWMHYPEPHFSIGASTAVFAALGLITGIGLWAAFVQPSERWSMPRWLLPAFGGLTLLGLLGLGDGLDGRTDVAAHINGFLCGTVLGFIGASRQLFFRRLHRIGLWLGLVTPSLILFAWLLALL